MKLVVARVNKLMAPGWVRVMWPCERERERGKVQV